MNKKEILKFIEMMRKERTQGYLFQPQLSTDIETTGLNREKDTMIEFACVFDNGKVGTKKKDMPLVKYTIWHPSITGNPYAIAKMEHNLEILKEMAELKENDVLKKCCLTDDNGNLILENNKPIPKKLKDYPVGWVTLEVLVHLMNEFFDMVKLESDLWYKTRNEKPLGLNFSGKNFANFDLPFIKRTFSIPNNDKMNDFLANGMKHRILDVGSIWFDSFAYMPSLGDLNRVLNRAEVSHDALDDVYDCVEAVRIKMELSLMMEEMTIAYLNSQNEIDK